MSNGGEGDQIQHPPHPIPAPVDEAVSLLGSRLRSDRCQTGQAGRRLGVELS